MSIEKQIKGLKQYSKILDGLRVSVSALKTGKVQVKFGKFIAITTPDKKWADRISCSFTATIRNEATAIKEVIHHIEQRYEQLSLELFKTEEENVETEGLGESKRFIPDTDRKINT